MRIWRIFLVVSWLLAGCAARSAPEVSATPVAQGGLTPYATRTRTLSLSQTPSPFATFTPLPSATPTPRLHTIARGETLLGIAFLYGVDLETLRQANPEVDPNLLKVGTSLVIPASADNPAAPTATGVLATPLPLNLATPFCASDALGGAWCFVLVRSQQELSLESIGVSFLMVDADNGEVASRTAYGLLNILPAGGEMPLAAYFPPPVPVNYRLGLQVVSALPLNPDDQRYLPVQVELEVEDAAADRRSVEVKGTVFLTSDEGSARRVWVLAAGYDQSGRAVALRRWEMAQGEELTVGGSLEFVIRLYAVAGEIARTALWAEARP